MPSQAHLDLCRSGMARPLCSHSTAHGLLWLLNSASDGVLARLAKSQPQQVLW